MSRKDIIEFIVKLSRGDRTKFIDYGTELEKIVNRMSLDDLKINLLECGIIPEFFTHDSTEEKAYAKYSDILLAKALTRMGIISHVIQERAGRADVEGDAKIYSLVADPKVFRLSRTAKNQKDFKVEALSKWKGDHDYASLVAPLYQYPKNKSQIYRQAIEEDVTLLSFAHLYFILSGKNIDKLDFRPLWTISKRLKKTEDAQTYWREVDETVCNLLERSSEELEKVKHYEMKLLKDIARMEIEFWEGRMESYQKIPKEEAIGRLIIAEKIKNKIKQIVEIASL